MFRVALCCPKPLIAPLMDVFQQIEGMFRPRLIVDPCRQYRRRSVIGTLKFYHGIFVVCDPTQEELAKALESGLRFGVAGTSRIHGVNLWVAKEGRLIQVCPGELKVFDFLV